MKEWYLQAENNELYRQWLINCNGNEGLFKSGVCKGRKGERDPKAINQRKEREKYKERKVISLHWE